VKARLLSNGMVENSTSLGEADFQGEMKVEGEDDFEFEMAIACLVPFRMKKTKTSKNL